MSDKKPSRGIQPVILEQEMQQAYLEYAMSVIVSRALPDVRDGLKPVHRRILYAMHNMGLRYNTKLRKSAAVVGDVLGKYHPHGDMAVYDSLVRMAQDFSLRYPLIKGQGNWGCFTKDTKIKLTDGRNLTFGDLIKERKKGKKNYAFVFNHQTQRIEIAEIKKPRLTRKNAPLVKVILDNGDEIKCTPDHRFMLRDGTYRQAKDLQSNDSLMPLYIKKFSGKTDLSLKNYELIYQPIQAKWDFIHRLADKFNLDHNIYFPKYSLRSNNCIPRFENSLKYFSSFGDLISQAKEWKNHRVISIEQLRIKENVYDITIDKHHNFALASGIFVHNSIDGDPPAAMRYTEAKMAKIADLMLADIDKETIPWLDNFDATKKEPAVLPAKLPNLLVNGTVGIAVGMASNILPHNLNEVIDATIAQIDKPEISLDELTEIIPGPDFPTGGNIYDTETIKAAYGTGKGPVVCRGKAKIIEKPRAGFQIIISEIPYQVNKADLVAKIASLVKTKRIEGIADIRDESDRQEAVRVVIELKTTAFPKKVLNQIFQLTPLQTTFHMNLVALVDGIQPRLLPLKEIIAEYIKHRRQVVTKRTQYELKMAQERKHILAGLAKALDYIDQVIATIRGSDTKEVAHQNLVKKFKLTVIQAGAILEMKLSALAGLERKRVLDELKEKGELIKELTKILASPAQILQIIISELKEIKKEFGDQRRTNIFKNPIGKFDIEDLVPDEKVIVTLTAGNYIKRVPVATYRSQNRGGKGIKGMDTKDEDAVKHLFYVSTHDEMMFFTDQGKVYKARVYEISAGSRVAKGHSLANIISLGPDENVTAVLPVPTKRSQGQYLIMATKQGKIKKTLVSAYQNVRQSGIIAIRLTPDDQLKFVRTSQGGDQVMMVTRQGQGIFFKETNVRAMGRSAAGVRGIRIRNEDEIIAMEVVAKDSNPDLITVLENGFGKRTIIRNNFKVQNRGGLGIRASRVTPKTGQLVAAIINEGQEGDLALISRVGTIIRVPIKAIKRLGRSTMGVTLMRLKTKPDKVSSVGLIKKEKIQQEIVEELPKVGRNLSPQPPKPRPKIKQAKTSFKTRKIFSLPKINSVPQPVKSLKKTSRPLKSEFIKRTF